MRQVLLVRERSSEFAGLDEWLVQMLVCKNRRALLRLTIWRINLI
jgi:hypothetical protein